MDRLEDLSKIFSLKIRHIINSLDIDYDKLQEIRLRVNAPLTVIYNNRSYWIDTLGTLTTAQGRAYKVSPEDIRETMEYISHFSLYAYEDEIRQGFMTIQGGHRVGIAGKVIVENERIKGIRYISFINIRLSHQVKGCGSSVLPYIMKTNEVCHTLIISPPRCGKTTILRDLIRQISDRSQETGISVGVVDERSEIAACHLGVPQNDLGVRTDVLDCCPKAEGMMMMIRSMSPGVIAVDEIGGREDLEAIEYVINCGCKLIATVHGSSVDDIRHKPILRRLVEERIFERYIVLNNKGKVGNVEAVFDAFGNNLFRS